MDIGPKKNLTCPDNPPPPKKKKNRYPYLSSAKDKYWYRIIGIL